MMFRGEHINVSEDRAVLHVALRMPRDATLVVDGVDVVAEVHDVLDRMAAFADRIRSGEWKGHTGKPIRNVVNVGIGGSDLGPVMAYEALRHYSRRDMTFRFVSNVDSTDFVEATRDLAADETLFIISSKTFGTLETLTNAHSARDWVVGAAGRRGRGGEALRRRVHERGAGGGVRDRHRQHVRVLGLGRRPLLDGLGHRPLDDDRRRPGGLRRDARRLPRDGRALPHDAAGGEPAGAHGAARRLVRRLLRRRDGRRDALRAVPQALPGLPAAADHGVQRQARHARRGAGRLRHRRRLLGRAGHERAAQLLPAHPPGHPPDPGRPDRLRQDAQPAPRPPRHPLVQRVRAGPGPRLRQDRGGGPGRGHAGGRRAAPGHGGQPAHQRDPGREAHALPARHAGRPVRAQRVHAGDDLGHRLLRPVGRRARQGPGRGDHPRAGERDRARADPRLVDQRPDPPLPLAEAEGGDRHDHGPPHAARDDRAGPDGRQPRPPAHARRPSLRGLRRQPWCGEEPGGRGRDGRDDAGRLRGQARQAAGHLDHGPGRGRPAHARPAGRPARGRRHRHRRRQLLLPRRHHPGQGAEGVGHPLRRLRHQRRRVGARPRLLPDDRRRGRRGRAPRPDLQDHRARGGQRRADARADPHRRDRPGRLPALRTERRGPLREDGPQRDRVRDDGGDRRGAEHHQARQRRQPAADRRRGDHPAARSVGLPVRDRRAPRSPRSGGGARSSGRGSWT